MANLYKTTVAVIGGGAMGLWLTMKLARLGIPTVLIEPNSEMARGPSIRNEGWRHSGAYHAAAIVDRRAALQVAQRTREGSHQTKQFAPEALEAPDARTFALVREQQVAEVRSRWEEAGVNYRPVSHRMLASLEPLLRLNDFAGLYEVDDQAINTSVLFNKLAAAACASGARLLTNTRVTALRDHVLTLEGPGGHRSLEAAFIVFTAGCGTKGLISALLGIELPFRFWRSHLLDARRFSRHGFFGICPGDATCMPHKGWSIVGLNADQEELTVPSFEPCPENVVKVREALLRLMPEAHLTGANGRACVKVDLDPGRAANVRELGFAPPQLNVSLGLLAENIYWLLPGKMTEAPFAADVLIRLLCDGKGWHEADLGSVMPLPDDWGDPAPRSALRPIDEYDSEPTSDVKNGGANAAR